MNTANDIPSKTTPEQQLFFCLLAAHKWITEVKPKDVVRDLANWSCGTQACFGGHLATWPEFVEIAGVRTFCGAPRNPSGVHSSYDYPDAWLLGDYTMFNTRGGHSADAGNDSVSDYELVIRRLDYRIKQLQEELA